MTYEHLDKQLVNGLLEGGRASLRNLAEKVDVSVTTVSNHLDELEEQGHIQRFVPVIGYDGFGYDVTAITHLKVEGSALPSITDWLATHEQFIDIYEVTGEYDVVLTGKFRDTDDMNKHIKQLLADPNVKESSTSVVLNAVRDHEQFALPIDAE